MENNEQDRALRPPAEASRDKHVNYFADEEEEADTNSSYDGSFSEMFQNEKWIDPVNEHHQRTDADDKIFDSDIDRAPRYDADAGGDGTGTAGPEPGEEKNEEDNIIGEDW